MHTLAQAQAQADIAGYVVDLYRFYVRTTRVAGAKASSEERPEAPPGVSDDLKQECDAVARTLSKAISNICGCMDAERVGDC